MVDKSAFASNVRPQPTAYSPGRLVRHLVRRSLGEAGRSEVRGQSLASVVRLPSSVFRLRTVVCHVGSQVATCPAAGRRGRPSSVFRLQAPDCRLPRRQPSGHHALGVVNLLATRFAWPRSGATWSSVVRRPSSGFTLVELLVVISIIAVLLGIIVPSYFSIREKAKYTKAKVTVKNLETAFKAYLDQYRVWPADFGGGAKDIDLAIVNILKGDKIAGKNDAGIAFYEFESTNAAGAFLDPFTTSTDPYEERPYRFQVDENYDNKITVGGQELYRSVIVWSVGTNRTDNGGTLDDIKSWD